MDCFAKRKRRPKQFSGTSSDEKTKRWETLPVDIDLSPLPVLEDMSAATPPKRSQLEATANVSYLWCPVVTTSQVTTHSIIPAASIPIRDTRRHFVQKTETVTKVKNATVRVSEHYLWKNFGVKRWRTSSVNCKFEPVAGASVQFMQCAVPVRNAWEFKRFDVKLEHETLLEQMLHFIVATGTRTVGDCVRQTTCTLTSDCFLHKLNWCGVHGRQSFANTRVCGITVHAVTKHNFPGATTLINEKIQCWIQRCRPTEVISTDSPL